MTSKSQTSSIDLQRYYDDDEHQFACYECCLVDHSQDEPDGECHIGETCYINTSLDAIEHLRRHIANGDIVPNAVIQALQDQIVRQTFVNQSLMEPSRRSDGSHSGEREKAFHVQWLKEQNNTGSPMLRQLFSVWGINDETPREVAIAASLIEWLGTNVGFCFLGEALKRCGYEIRKIEK
ncbi:hypothetical protein [Rosistilla oblonga]|uniref:hypothetical protein n=1 Tax=Rosistilla oblonga TaxID=2527990 RepID=UPI003A97DEF8